ncbi:MAG TPA: glutamine--fructose-6-phosphate transaminase (isomerizing) [Rickettsiales bacterium]|nr:glutamine--fructose-6-phosphate transaminase (isomerizing) [Rickettsiales bacterium]
MCGIFGVVSNKDVVQKLISGLKCLEYRGYDSAGLSVIEEEIKTIKKVGKVSELENLINSSKIAGNIGIAHSRWATHGEPTEVNAHPHNSINQISVVHNGIIENYKELKSDLIKNGYEFKSQTDTETIPNLISYFLKEKNDKKQAILKTLNKLKGTFGIAVIFNDDTNHIYCARRGSPLLLGLGKDENYVSSGLSAFTGLTNKIISLQEDDFAIISQTDYEIFNKKGEKVKREIETISIDNINVDKGNFEHFMLKEIFEQPKVVEQTIKEYVDTKNKEINFPHFTFDLSKLEKLNIVSCGTSYYASFIAKYFIEKVAKIKVDIDIASEFRYKNPMLSKNDISMFISQSGETADTIGALKLCKENGQKIISLVNVLQSNIAYLSDMVLKTLAGAEIGVASTKALTGQLVVLYLLGIKIAISKGTISKTEYKNYIEDLISLPQTLEKFLSDKSNIENIQSISKKVKDKNFFMYIGRGIYYPLALEGALKLKEISYIPCEGVAAGELKHGPIALIDKETYIFAINPSGDLFEKTASNIEEIAARNGKIVLISDKDGQNFLQDKTSENIIIEKNENNMMSAIECLVPIQLIAYYISLERGNNIDKPRNLAKSVTVE